MNKSTFGPLPCANGPERTRRVHEDRISWISFTGQFGESNNTGTAINPAHTTDDVLDDSRRSGKAMIAPMHSEVGLPGKALPDTSDLRRDRGLSGQRDRMWEIPFTRKD